MLTRNAFSRSITRATILLSMVAFLFSGVLLQTDQAWGKQTKQFVWEPETRGDDDDDITGGMRIVSGLSIVEQSQRLSETETLLGKDSQINLRDPRTKRSFLPIILKSAIKWARTFYKK